MIDRLSAHKHTSMAATVAAAAAPVSHAEPEVEYLEIFTPEGVTTGAKKAKKDVHRDGDWYASALSSFLCVS